MVKPIQYNYDQAYKRPLEYLKKFEDESGLDKHTHSKVAKKSSGTYSYSQKEMIDQQQPLRRRPVTSLDVANCGRR